MVAKSHVLHEGTGKVSTTFPTGVTMDRGAGVAARNAPASVVRPLTTVGRHIKPDWGGALSGVRTGMPYDFNKVLEPVR